MVGIVIPAYKRREVLYQALLSLELQTNKDFIVIVVDDHSPEPLEDVVREFDGKLNYIYKYAEVNGGPGAARQLGLEECYEIDVKYVMFLDSDDMLYPHAVDRLVHVMEESGCSLVGAQVWQEHVDGGGGIIPSDNETWLHGKIFLTSYLKENDIRFPKLRTNEDVAFNLIASQCAPKKGTLDEILYLFKYDNNSITHQGNPPLGMLSTDYIEALYCVVEYMMKKYNRITDQVLIDIIAIYNHYQVGKIVGLMTNEIKEEVKYMLHLPQVQAALTSFESLKQFTPIINQYLTYADKVYYFSQTFYHWLKEFEAI